MVETLYFMIFCLAIAYVIYWSLRNDDMADFDDSAGGSKKFTLPKRPGAKDSDKKEN